MIEQAKGSQDVGLFITGKDVEQNDEYEHGDREQLVIQKISDTLIEGQFRKIIQYVKSIQDAPKPLFDAWISLTASK